MGELPLSPRSAALSTHSGHTQIMMIRDLRRLSDRSWVEHQCLSLGYRSLCCRFEVRLRSGDQVR
jgi:hypothetical protein